MKTKNTSGCFGIIALGIVGLVISFIMDNIWIIIIPAVIIVLAIIIGVYSSLNNQSNNQNNQSIFETNKLSDPEKHSYTNTSSYSYNKHDNTDVTYSKIEAVPDDYIVFDIETTGLKYFSDAILEIGAIKYIDNVEAERFHTYVKTTKEIPDYITKINGITFSTIKDAPLIRSALKDFIAFIDNYTLIAYNSDFDMSFIQYNCRTKLNRSIENNVIDALPLAIKYLEELPNKKLETVKSHFGLNVGSHNALDDCIVTNHLYQYCKKYEVERFKYAIPFTYQPQDLNDTEAEYLKTVVEILESKGINKSDMGLKYSSKYLEIYDNQIDKYRFHIRIKMYGKLQYVLLEVPLKKFESECNTDVKHTEGSTNERGMTRVFTENPQQLWDFEKFFVK